MATKPSKGIFSEEHKKKIGNALRGRHLSPSSEFKKGHKAIAWNKGIPMRSEVKLKLSQSLKGRTSWAKGKTFSAEYRKKLSIAHMGDNPCQAKNASYYSTHGWISRHKVRPDVCSHCKQKKTYTLQWANTDHKYRLDINDWIALCASCHRIYDLKNGLRK